MFFKFLVTKEHTKQKLQKTSFGKVWRLKPAVHCIFLKSSLLQGMANLSFSLKERQNSARFNCAAVTINKMTSRSCEDRNCFKGQLIVVFSHNNLALTFPTNTELLGCLEGYLEGSRELKIFCSSLQRIHSLD